MGCFRDKSNGYQPLPSSNLLKRKPNHYLSTLRDSVNPTDLSAQVYYYVITTIRRRGDTLQHTGSGPNWQEGIITLCTCKHYMRSLLDVNNWRGTWVAGFSTISNNIGRHFLIFLTRIDKAFESHWRL